MLEHCQGVLPREVVESPVLKVFKRGVDVMFSGGLGSAKLIAELNGIKGIFQTK